MQKLGLKNEDGFFCPEDIFANATDFFACVLKMNYHRF